MMMAPERHSPARKAMRHGLVWYEICSVNIKRCSRLHVVFVDSVDTFALDFVLKSGGHALLMTYLYMTLIASCTAGTSTADE